MLNIFKKLIGENYLDGLLWKACYLNDTRSVTKLLKTGVNPNEISDDYTKEYPWRENTPLGIAIKNKNFLLIELLLKHGAIVDYHHPGLCKSLFNIDMEDKNALKMFEYLVKKGAEVNSKDGIETSLLVYSIYRDCYEIFEYLLSQGADPNYDCNNKITPIIMACYESPRSIELLLKSGADPYKKVFQGHNVFDHLKRDDKKNILISREVFKSLGYKLK